MNMLNFEQPQHFLQCVSDSRQLSAFALGAAEQSVYDHLKDERSEIPTSLARQQAIERIAREQYNQYLKVATLKQSLKKHADTLLVKTTGILRMLNYTFSTQISHWLNTTPPSYSHNAVFARVPYGQDIVCCAK